MRIEVHVQGEDAGGNGEAAGVCEDGAECWRRDGEWCRGGVGRWVD